MRKDFASLHCSVWLSISHSDHPPGVLISSLFGSLAPPHRNKVLGSCWRGTLSTYHLPAAHIGAP